MYAYSTIHAEVHALLFERRMKSLRQKFPQRIGLEFIAWHFNTDTVRQKVSLTRSGGPCKLPARWSWWHRYTGYPLKRRLTWQSPQLCTFFKWRTCSCLFDLSLKWRYMRDGPFLRKPYFQKSIWVTSHCKHSWHHLAYGLEAHVHKIAGMSPAPLLMSNCLRQPWGSKALKSWSLIRSCNISLARVCPVWPKSFIKCSTRGSYNIIVNTLLCYIMLYCCAHMTYMPVPRQEKCGWTTQEAQQT